MSAISRWRFDATLITTTPLHVGDGETVPVPIQEKDGRSKEVKANSVMTDHKKKAYVPGSTLKGCIRSWLAARVNDKDQINRFFEYGKREVGKKDEQEVDLGAGGIVEFWNAYAVDGQTKPDSAQQPTLWDSERLTALAASTAIDRRSRTASDEKLYHYEYVPPGVEFKFTITAQFNDDTTENFLCLLSALKTAFTGAEDGVAIGSSTGDGWGRMKMEKVSIKKMDTEAIKKWMACQDKNGNSEESGWWIVAEGDADKTSELGKTSNGLTSNPQDKIVFDVRLSFDAQFLVNDSLAPREVEGEKQPDMLPRRDKDGMPYLPAASFRGAFRSQAEKILRTIAQNNGHDPLKAACHVTGKETAKCKESVTKSDQVKGLCLACKLFGASGWRSPVEVTDFTIHDKQWPKDEKELTQEFVAIDRFTGGVAGSKKFNARAAIKPVLSGKIIVDIKALKSSPVGADAWGRGLLALTLRDLVEGDIRFGMGASKGYGACRATISSQHPEWKILNNLAEAGEGEKKIVGEWINALHEAVKDPTSMENNKEPKVEAR